MQSENGLSPEQLWLRGKAWFEGPSTEILVSYLLAVLQPKHKQTVGYNEWFCCPQTQAALYGIDWDAPLGTDEGADAVEVPATPNPLTPADYSQLCQLVDPASDSDNHGINHYLAAVHFTQHKVSQY